MTHAASMRESISKDLAIAKLELLRTSTWRNYEP